MVYLASALITKAYTTSGITSADIGDAPDDGQIDDGLTLLNEILSEIGINGKLLPYTTQYNVAAVVGQETYLIPNLIQWQAMTFAINTVRYSLTYQGRTNYFASPRANNITSLSTDFTFERTNGGSNLSIYFLPDQNYPLTVTGLFGFNSVLLNTDMTPLCDNFYLKYLRLVLAQSLCAFNLISLPTQSAQQLQDITQTLSTMNTPDMTMKKTSLFGTNVSINYAQANLGQGWTN